MYKIKMLPFVYDTCMCAYHTCACVYDVAGRVEEENPPPPAKQIQHSRSYVKILYC